MVTVGVKLHHFHRFKLLQSGFLSDLVFTLIRIVLKVTHIGNVTHVAYLVTEVLQVAVEQVKRDRRTGMTQMGVTVHGRTADIHAYVSFVQRFERLFESC